MDGFIIRVSAYHGEPQLVGKVHVRSGVSYDTPVPKKDVVNDPDNDVVVDLGVSWPTPNAVRRGSDYTLDSLVDDFQDEYECKVNYSGIHQDKAGSELQVVEFDMFEPSWPEKEEAEDVIDELTRRVRDWVQGYPTGR